MFFADPYLMALYGMEKDPAASLAILEPMAKREDISDEFRQEIEENIKKAKVLLATENVTEGEGVIDQTSQQAAVEACREDLQPITFMGDKPSKFWGGNPLNPIDDAGVPLSVRLADEALTGEPSVPVYKPKGK